MPVRALTFGRFIAVLAEHGVAIKALKKFPKRKYFERVDEAGTVFRHPVPKRGDGELMAFAEADHISVVLGLPPQLV